MLHRLPRVLFAKPPLLADLSHLKHNSDMKVLPFLLLLGLALPVFAQMPKIEPGVPHDLAIWRAAYYSDVRYKLNLTLEKMSPVLKGTIEIRVSVAEPPELADKSRNLEIYPTPPIILDWRPIAGHEKIHD